MSDNPFKKIMDEHRGTVADMNGFNELFKGIFKDSVFNDSTFATTPNGNGGNGGGDDGDVHDVHDWHAAYDSLKSEYDAYRKRMEARIGAERVKSVKGLLNALLDAFEMQCGGKGDALMPPSMELSIKGILAPYGIFPMESPKGKPYDESRETAILSDSSGSAPEGTVTRVFSQGYVDGDGSTVRYAKVSISTLGMQQPSKDGAAGDGESATAAPTEGK